MKSMYLKRGFDHNEYFYLKTRYEILSPIFTIHKWKECLNKVDIVKIKYPIYWNLDTRKPPINIVSLNKIISRSLPS